MDENRRRESVHLRRSKEEEGFDDPSGRVFFIRSLSDILIIKLPAKSDTAVEKPNLRERVASLRSMARNPGIMLTGCVEAATLFAYGTMEVFLPLYARTVGLGTFEVDTILSAQVITLAATKPAMGPFSDRHGRAPPDHLGWDRRRLEHRVRLPVQRVSEPVGRKHDLRPQSVGRHLCNIGCHCRLEPVRDA